MDYQREYGARNASWHVEDSAWKADRVLEMIARNGLRPRRVLEVGCGAGEVLRRVHETIGGECTGVDVSGEAIALASARVRPGLRYERRDVTSDDLGHHDLVLAIDVIEHVPDYLGFLRRISELADQGVFHVPLDMNVLNLFLPGRLLRERETVGHLHYFSPETALATLADGGWTVVDSFYTASTLDLPPHSWRMRAASVPRRLLRSVSGRLAARMMGGLSLMVLADSDRSARSSDGRGPRTAGGS